MNEYFDLATKATVEGMKRQDGGPFGATIVCNGEVIAAMGNTMMWANIKKVYYSSTRADAAAHGFSDMHLRDYLAGTDQNAFAMEAIGPREDCDQLWEVFEALNPEA